MTEEQRDLVAEYAEFTKNALKEADLPPEDKDIVEDFLDRVLGPELRAWMDRGRKYGYGSYDEDGEPLED